MNNTDSNVIKDIVNKIPITLYYHEIPDRQQALSYINWLYTNVPQSKSVSQDAFFREVISRELRITSMKIIEIEILLIVGLTTITLEDFTSDSTTLLNKLVSQNIDKYDLDTLYKVLSQIMTKLPNDLKDRVTGKHKLEIFQLVSKHIKMEPKLLEKFIAFDPSINTPVSMELDQGDYNTLNKKYLEDMKTYKDSQSYVTSNSMEYVQLESAAANMIASSPATVKDKISAQYIDQNPIIMTGKEDNKLYYYDPSSGTMSEMPPLNNTNSVPVSAKDIQTLLTNQKIDKTQIKGLINSLKNTQTTIPPTTTQPSLMGKVSNFFSSLPIIGSSPTTTIPASYTPGSNVLSAPPAPPQFLASAVSGDQQYSGQWGEQQYSGQWGGQQGSQTRIGQDYNSILSQTSVTNASRRPGFLSDNKLPNRGGQTINPTTTQNNPTTTQNNPNTTQNNPTTTQQISHFSNMNMNMNINQESEFIKKITKNNQDIENVALGFVTAIIILFLLVIFNEIRNKSGLVSPPK